MSLSSGEIEREGEEESSQGFPRIDAPIGPSGLCILKV